LALLPRFAQRGLAFAVVVNERTAKPDRIPTENSTGFAECLPGYRRQRFRTGVQGQENSENQHRKAEIGEEPIEDVFDRLRHRRRP
jgi:hypothetical protein